MHFLHKIAFIFLVIFGVMSTLGYYLAPQNKLSKSDAIVAVSGGDNELRTKTAVDLYRHGWSKNLVFSGAARDPASPSNAFTMSLQARAEGVPESVIILDELSRNTDENARHFAAIAKKNNFDSIILVTSPYHQRRAYNEFKQHLPDDAVVLNYSAKDDDWRRSQWWVSPRGWYLTLGESAKIVVGYLGELINITNDSSDLIK